MRAHRKLTGQGLPWGPVEVAARWSRPGDVITPALVERMCREGRIPGAFKAGRKWRISEQALIAYEAGSNPFGSIPFASGVAP